MKSHFDELAKDLARGVSRREALGRFGVGLAALATGMILGRRTASAQEDCEAEYFACRQQARKQQSACDRTCSPLRKEERAACVAACAEQYEQALAACVPCGTCDNPGTCGTFALGCNGNPDCVCMTTPEGGGACVSSSLPSCQFLTACTTSADCDPGFICAVNTCCGEPGVCVPECGNSAPTALRGDGPTVFGRSL